MFKIVKTTTDIIIGMVGIFLLSVMLLLVTLTLIPSRKPMSLLDKQIEQARIERIEKVVWMSNLSIDEIDKLVKEGNSVTDKSEPGEPLFIIYLKQK